MIRETKYNEVFDAQMHFRLLMDSMARPGKINVLNGVDINPPALLNRASALVGLALLNADVTYFARLNANNSTVADYFRVNTASLPTTADNADFLFLSGADDTEQLEAAKVGSLSYPDTGATVLLDVTEIADTPTPGASLQLNLSGPGVPGTKTIFVSGLNPALLEIRRDKNAEYPLGIDLLLTDVGDRFICLPRTTFIRSELVDA